MNHEQYIIQSDAQKTFDNIFKGPRIYQNLERKDAFIDWIEQNAGNTDTHKLLNEMFFKMRKSINYSFKRHCMILQYEIMAIGLKSQLKKGGQQEDEKEDKIEGHERDKTLYTEAGDTLYKDDEQS